jgi:integrase
LLEFFAANIRNPHTGRAYYRANAYAMIRRRAAAAGIGTKLGNHSFRATGITAYLKNGGRWKRRRRWRIVPRRARRNSTIAGGTSSASMRSSGS